MKTKTHPLLQVVLTGRGGAQVPYLNGARIKALSLHQPLMVASLEL